MVKAPERGPHHVLPASTTRRHITDTTPGTGGSSGLVILNHQGMYVLSDSVSRIVQSARQGPKRHTVVPVTGAVY